MSASFFKRLSLLFLVLTITQLACSALIPAPTPNASDVEKEEQAIYSFFVSGGSSTAIILQETSASISESDPQQTLKYIQENMPNMSGEVLNSFEDRNAQPSQLLPDMQLGTEYVLLGSDELASIFQQSNGWETFYKKYGYSGYVQFSRVGFNSTLDQALVYVGSMGGPLMGSGSYYLMEKKNGQWLIKEQVMAWIS